MMKDLDFDGMRLRMVSEQLIARGISDPRVLDAFKAVPRQEFIPQELWESAYGDFPLPIGNGQTISQPYMVALMTESLALRGRERVLEVGTGSGYQTAILAKLAGEIYSVERIGTLAQKASDLLKKLGHANCSVTTGDGTLGWQAHAPYDGIVVTAGAPKIPDSLVGQLKDGGRLVIPVGGSFGQTLTLVEKHNGRVTSSDICGCVFVPLIGAEGWRA